MENFSFLHGSSWTFFDACRQCKPQKNPRLHYVEEEDHKIKHQTPLIKLLKLVYSMPEIEPGKKRYIGQLQVETSTYKHSLFVMRALFYDRIPTVYRDGGALSREYYDLLSKEFDFYVDRVEGRSWALHPLGSNPDDPRVFRGVEVFGMDQYDYCPHVFNIKTKDLRIHLDNIALYDTLPEMPHLETMFCHINPIGLYDYSVASSHYEKLAERLAIAAPYLYCIGLKMNCAINCNSLENGEKAFIRALSSLELAVDGLNQHILVDPKFFNITLFLPAKAREELPARVESTVIDEDESLGVDVNDELNHDVCAHFKRLMYWHINEAGIPDYLELETNMHFRFLFDDGVDAEHRRDKRIDPQNGYHFWVDRF
uniref:Uncharacterized protein n=1 Tax=Bursaphelenchus xylophilus TaxID=6326 RepID=A0A1I7SB11_BURXY